MQSHRFSRDNNNSTSAPSSAASPSALSPSASRASLSALTPLAFAVRMALSASLLGMAVQAQAQTASAPAAVSYDVPAGALADALNRYAQQSGIAIAIDADKVQGKTSPGLHGSYDIEAGFRVLLRGTGLEMRKTEAGYVLVASPQSSGNGALPAVSVNASADSGLHLSDTVASGALGARSQLDTPFSMAVIKADELAERQINKLGDVFALDASVSDNSGGYSSWASYLTVRGLALDWQNSYRIDGKPFLSYAITLPYEHFESIELLKGASGYMYGFGSPGGLINYVTKRPTDTPVRSVDVGFKSNNIWSEHVDLGGRFGNDNMFGYRLNATHEDGKTFNDGQIRRDSVSLALDARLTRDLTWEFQSFYQNRNSSGQTPSIYTAGLASGAQLPVVPSSDDQTLVGKGQHLNTNFQQYSTGLKYDISSDWKLSTDYSHSSSRRSRNESTLSLTDTAGDYSDSRSDTREGHTFDQWQVMLQGKARTGWLEHALVFGGAWQKQVNNYSSNSVYNTAVSGNLYQQNTNDYDSIVDLRTYRASDITQQAAFASDTLKFSEQWSLLAGARYTNFTQNTYDTSGARTAQYQKDGVITPTIALMYKPEPNTTLYTSYVESLEQGGTPTVTNTNYGQTLKPLVSKQYELGVKSEQERWSTTAAVFRIERAAEYTDGSGALVQNGQSTYQGLELGGAAKVSKDWQISSNLMLLSTEYSRGTNYNGNRVVGAPNLVAAGQVSYLVPQVQGLKLSADTKYTGSTMLRAANDIKLSGYTLFNLGASYMTRIGTVDTTFRAAVNNLTDKRYWEFQYENYVKPGDPRTFSLSVKLDF